MPFARPSRRRLVLALTLASMAGGPARAAIDPAAATAVFREAQVICDRDRGALWGRPLCGAMLLVDPEDRTVIANQADAKGALDTLFLGLGAVALLVGAIGVANIMIISVLERRQEIGLRRALGATRGQIRAQFLAEAIMLSLAGGAVGVLAGAAATTWFAHAHAEEAVIPLGAWAGGLVAAIVIGALAGLLPAIRAARLSPTQALWSV